MCVQEDVLDMLNTGKTTISRAEVIKLGKSAMRDYKNALGRIERLETTTTEIKDQNDRQEKVLNEVLAKVSFVEKTVGKKIWWLLIIFIIAVAGAGANLFQILGWLPA